MVRVSRLGLASSLLVFLTMLTGFVLIGSRAVAEGESGIDPVSCTIAYTEGEGRSVTTTNGSYTDEIGNSTLKVTCDDPSGFAIYAVGYSGKEVGNNKMIATVNGVLNPEYDIVSSEANSGDTSAWAMKVSAVAGAYAPTIDNEFSDYKTIPTDYTRVAYRTNTTDNAVGSSIRLAYAIYASGTQPAGGYAGEVKYVLVNPHTEQPCGDQKICYKKNGNDVVGTMGKQTVSSNTATLIASNYSRAGYGFAGWNTKADGTGTSYGPNETITLPSDMSDGLYLFAMWVASAGDLQGWEGCYNMSAGQVTALTDTRDNDTYAVAKLADGNCWMIENLRLDNTAELTIANTHNPLNDGTNVTLKHNYDDTITYNTLSATASVAYDADTAPEGWCNTSSAACIDQSRLRTDNTARRANNPVSGMNANIYGYGNYYNWYSITAGNGTYELNEDNNSTVGDICPAGWRLPQGGNKNRIESDDDNDFWNLVVDALNGGVYPANYNGSTTPYYNGSTEAGPVDALIRSYPNNFVYSGFTSAGGMGSRGAAANYWASTAHNEGAAYFMYFDNSLVSPGTGWGGGKSTGRPARCLAPSVRWFSSEIDFDEGVTSVTLDGGIYGSYTVDTNGEIVRLAGGVDYNISATYATDEDGFASWETTSDGVLGSASSRETTFTLNDAATLTLNSKKVCPAGKICYKDNGANSTTTMDKQSISSSATSATLWASNFKRVGYGFAGWSDAADYVVNVGSQTNPNAHIYGPSETITFAAGQYSELENGLFLYAVWVESTGNLQEWSACYTMNIGDVIALTDTRDKDTYAIAKLADGNCWFIENLRLDYGANITTANTHSDGAFGGVFTGLAQPETDNFTTSTAANSLYTTDTSSTTLNVITGNYLAYRIPRYRNDNTANSVEQMMSNTDQVYSYGNYYNFPAAIASTNDIDGVNQSVENTSICPTGWRLPTGGDKDNENNNEFWSLIVDGLNEGVLPVNYASETAPYYDTDKVEVSKKVRAYPNNFVFSGASWGGSEMGNWGSVGYYWTSTIGGNTNAYTFRLDSVYPGTYSINRFNGRSVRCVLDLDYRVIYEPSTLDTVTNMPSDNPQVGSVKVTMDSITISANVPLRSGYRFRGWCDEHPNNGVCSGNIYNPYGDGTNLDIPLDFTTDNYYTLYAMWYIPPDPCAGLTSTKLYDLVACRSKGTQTMDDLAEELTVPTSSNSAADTSTSGVYEYNVNEFGAASDARNDYNIYYYRGILDSNLDGTSSTYGSAGDGTYYPNYVILDEDGTKDTSDTCWRIVRTTGSGGIKMIYNGVWNGTSCANAGNDTLTTTMPFNNYNSRIMSHSILSIGYTFNNNYALTTANTSYSTLFGTNANYAGNSTDSSIKDHIEDTWFSTIDDYEGMLETSAGYCNDRTLYRFGQSLTKVGDNTAVETPFNDTNGSYYLFGGSLRNIFSLPLTSNATLGCARDKADLYTVSGAATGNGQMSKPVAMITADELTFAGSGLTHNDLHYSGHQNSYLRSGKEFWTMTPGERSGSDARGMHFENISMNYRSVSMNLGVRPVISFKHYTTVGSGSGTAADPWVVNMVNSMQAVSKWGPSLNVGDEVEAVDDRDGKTYYVAKLADGNIWMTQNLDHEIVTKTDFYTYENTDIGHGATTDMNAKWTASTATYATGDLTWRDYRDAPESYDPGDKIWDGVPSMAGSELDDMVQGTDRHYHLGNYYNWTAAVAMNDSSSFNAANMDASQSICPAGWTLPKGANSTASGSFKNLMTSYGYDVSFGAIDVNNPTTWESPYYFTFAGLWNNTSQFIGSVGYYWASSTGSVSSMGYVIDVDYTRGMYLDTNDDRFMGNSVRCVTR